MSVRRKVWGHNTQLYTLVAIRLVSALSAPLPTLSSQGERASGSDIRARMSRGPTKFRVARMIALARRRRPSPALKGEDPA